MSQHGEVEDEPKGSYKSYNTSKSQCSNDDFSLGKIEVDNQLKAHVDSQLQHFNEKFQTSELQQRPKMIIMFLNTLTLSSLEQLILFWNQSIF
jgi:hypothetical protein